MVKKKRGSKEFLRSLIHCSFLAGSTFERMIELVSQSLYFHPDFDTRMAMMKQYYDNVILFIEDISVVLRNNESQPSSLRFIYESFFTNLKNICNELYDLQYLFSTKYHEFSNMDMDELISLNKTVVYSINFFNRIIQTLDTKSSFDGSWHIGELESAANEHKRVIFFNLLQSSYTWQNALMIQTMAERMVNIVRQCGEATRKIAFVKPDESEKKKK